MASPIICEVRNLSVPPPVRGEVSFTLREGDRLCVYGHSASGKSTLLRALLGLIPYRGEVIWHVPRASIGYASQRPRLIARATVLQQILWCAQLHGVYLSTHGSRIHELLEQWGLQAKRRQAVRRLSLGEQIRLEMCCAMATASRLLVVDGVLEQVDEQGRAIFWEEVDTRCARRELALIIATHSAREAEMADRVLLLHEGRMVALDTPEHLRALASHEELQLRSVQAHLRRVGEKQEEMHLVLQRMPTMEDVLRTLLRQGGSP